MTTTAKVKLTSKTPAQEGTEYESVLLGFNADYEDGRNKEWSVATPALSVSMTVKPDVAQNFNVGDAFTLTFEKE